MIYDFFLVGRLIMMMISLVVILCWGICLFGEILDWVMFGILRVVVWGCIWGV